MHFCFWATVCKTVRPMLSDRCLSFLSVCNVGVLWPNGWVDQDATWYRGRPRPRRHRVRWGPSSPTASGTASPTFGPTVLARSPISATAELLSHITQIPSDSHLECQTDTTCQDYSYISCWLTLPLMSCPKPSIPVFVQGHMA